MIAPAPEHLRKSQQAGVVVVMVVGDAALGLEDPSGLCSAGLHTTLGLTVRNGL